MACCCLAGRRRSFSRCYAKLCAASIKSEGPEASAIAQLHYWREQITDLLPKGAGQHGSERKVVTALIYWNGIFERPDPRPARLWAAGQLTRVGAKSSHFVQPDFGHPRRQI